MVKGNILYMSNKRQKITDLEKFALEEIFRPYQTMLDFGEKRLKKLPIPLDKIPNFISNHQEWWKLVKARITPMDVYFPDYIHHELVDFICYSQCVICGKPTLTLTGLYCSYACYSKSMKEERR